jgi:hypothetical protein
MIGAVSTPPDAVVAVSLLRYRRNDIRPAPLQLQK